MQCLKCGKETENERTFCPSCMEDMEKYPVKPGTPVQLPIRPGGAANRKPPARKRPNIGEKEQIAKLGHKVKVLDTLLMVMVAALMVVTLLLVQQYYKTPDRPTGQNYSTVTVETTPQT